MFEVNYSATPVTSAPSFLPSSLNEGVIPISCSSVAGSTTIVAPPSDLDLFMLAPLEIVMMILKNLSFQDLVVISGVSKEWNLLAFDDRMWKIICLEFITESAHCKVCKQGVLAAINRRAALGATSWVRLFKETYLSQKTTWGQIWQDHRPSNTINANTVQFLNNRTTVKNVHGGWNIVQLGDYPVLPFGVYHYSFKVDHFSCNGVMFGLATNKWRGVYPGTGNSGITANTKSVAYYSHNTTVFNTGDIICMCLDMERKVVIYHKNGEIVGTSELPTLERDEDGEELFAIGAFCGNYHQVSITYAHNSIS